MKNTSGSIVPVRVARPLRSVVVLGRHLGALHRAQASHVVVGSLPIAHEVDAVAYCSLGVEVGRNLDAYLAPDRTASREGRWD